MGTIPKETEPYKEFYDELSSMGDTSELSGAYAQAKEAAQGSTELNVSSLEKAKQDAEASYEKEVRSAKGDYKKDMNPYGVMRESVYEKGLSGSGYSESTMAKNYQSLQNRISNAYAVSENAKGEFDSAISKARSEGESSLAKLALDEYTAKTNNLWKMYEEKLQLENDRLDYEKYLTGLIRADEQEAYERKKDRDVKRKKYR